MGMVGDAISSQPGYLYGEPTIGPGDALNMTGDSVRHYFMSISIA